MESGISDENFKNWIINSSIGQSALRNQGKGIIVPIREKIIEKLHIPDFFSKLNQNGKIGFKKYLNTNIFNSRPRRNG